MALQASGAIDLSDIQTEFGGTNPVSLSEYYRNGGFTTSNNTSVPTSGEISLSSFYNGTGATAFSITSNTNAGLNLRTAAVAAGWDGATPVTLTVTPSSWIHRTLTIDGSWPGGVTLVNGGKITGSGGGATSAGQPAIDITTSDSVNITNSSGAFIAGGGGGGGGSQGGGGAGQADYGQAGAAGGSFSVSQGVSGGYQCPYGCSEGGSMCGTLSCTVSGTGYRAAGGQQGASSGSGNISLGNCYATTTLVHVGGGPGSCSPMSYSGTLIGGTGGPNPGGEGGSILSATQNQTVSGGGWGLAGADGGGAGGAAISGTYASFTDNGTVYGSV